ncbi:DUF6193 family natural product biosynthesis protein [Streptomyces sp. RGM 3693]|uniref:DUF6193 family natural product biosynthesis protein n=1 Tax=Streptomyces sp. RGM 3693 TaxID=3413284 RepID=UPI003D2A52FF
MPEKDGACSEVLSAVNVDLYPDLVHYGGLTSAIIRISMENGAELGSIRPASESRQGRFVTAEVKSERGPILVFLGAEERWFSISIEGDGHQWAGGGTDDLLTVIKVLEAWRRGVGLKELRTRFSFMHYDDLAEAREAGDPVSFQWIRLLADEQFSSARPLLRQIHSNGKLCTLFPAFSRGVLRLAKDYSDRTAGEISVTPLRGGHYRVESTDPGANGREVDSMDGAIDAILSLLGHP